MNKKKVVQFLLKPPGIFLVLIYLATLGLIAATIVLLTQHKENTALAYIVFPMTAILFFYSIFTLVRRGYNIKKQATIFLKRFWFTKKLITDYGFRTLVLGTCTFAINVGYAIFEGVMGVLTQSTWFGALAFYYLILSVMRCSVLLSGKKMRIIPEIGIASYEIQKNKVYRRCGIFIVLLALAFSGPIIQMIIAHKYNEYAGIMIYVVASYTFYKVVLSIVNIVKADRHKDPIIQALRNINLTDAMVSLLALQTALITAFSTGDDLQSLNVTTGSTVSAITLGLGIFMIIRSNQRIKKLNLLVENEEVI